MKSPLRRVMVPLDGSPLSQQALGLGAGIARREGAALHLVTVIAPLATLPTEGGTFAHDYTVEQALHDGSDVTWMSRPVRSVSRSRACP